MVSIKGKSKPTKPLNKNVTSIKAAPAFKEERQKISAKANLKKSAPKKKVTLGKNAPKAFAKVDDTNSGKDGELQSKKNSSLGPKVSKSKAGKKKAPLRFLLNLKRNFPLTPVKMRKMLTQTPV
ncbi:hypothetical protein DSO57_1030782 [Entomophthora muscae]|uniref:Uncharacterized protein n=1 Tax=Entomophthora muscae TaxID=34485 RepID=A0ACC2RFI0_9FUNG|nr:hypothetical protein DSO57_1030782 [Entomophthora muscae]